MNASILLDVLDTVEVVSSAGIGLDAPSAALLAHNTMYFSRMAPGAGEDPPVRAIFVGPGAVGPSATGASSVTVEGNLVVTDDPRMAFLRASCSHDGLGFVRGNRHAGFVRPADGSGCTSGMLEELRSDGLVDDVAFTCPSTGCRTLFRNDASSLSLLLRGLELSPDTACGRGLATTGPSAIPADATGRTRPDAGATAGAFELECP